MPSTSCRVRPCILCQTTQRPLQQAVSDGPTQTHPDQPAPRLPVPVGAWHSVGRPRRREMKSDRGAGPAPCITDRHQNECTGAMFGGVRGVPSAWPVRKKKGGWVQSRRAKKGSHKSVNHNLDRSTLYISIPNPALTEANMFDLGFETHDHGACGRRRRWPPQRRVARLGP